LFNSAVDLDQDVYLRLPFPLVISLFYGYFAQVDRLRKGAREKDELAKRQQQTAEELRHTHDIKDEFLRSVSTKLKTPLSVITGYADMFRTGLLGATTPIQEKAIETVSRQAKELQGLINSVLLVTYMETEPLHAELRDLDLWELLSELRAKYSDPPGKPVRLVWKYPADLPAVQGDRGKFKRILENLIDNALQFTDRGSITVAIQYSAASESLEIKVSDSGVGIPTTKLATIFDRFRQADSVDAGLQRGGFGLGLYIVKKYLDLLGGSMHVDSRVGEGSTFSLQIPAPMGKRLATHEPVSSANGRYRRKILLALKTREKKSPRRPGG
jgi:signal transduction histidine kinase